MNNHIEIEKKRYKNCAGGWLLGSAIVSFAFVILNLVLTMYLRSLAAFLLLVATACYVNVAFLWFKNQIADLGNRLAKKAEEPEAVIRWFQGQITHIFTKKHAIAAGLVLGVGVTVSVYHLGIEYPLVELKIYCLTIVFIAGFFIGVALVLVFKYGVLVARLPDDPAILRQVPIPTYQSRFSFPTSVGALSLKVGYASLLYYLLWVAAIFVSPYKVGPLLLSWMTGCAVILISIFLVPQVCIHRFLLERKRDNLARISPVLENALSNVLENPQTANCELLWALSSERTHMEKMNTWAFNLKGGVSLILGYLVPLIAGVVKLILASP